jgi:prophage regulatory protein
MVVGMDALAPNHTAPDSLGRAEFLRLPDVLARIPVSKSTWWAGIKEGRYPRGVKLSARTTAWRRCDIECLVRKLAADDT